MNEVIEDIVMLPCPFCGGPPVMWIHDSDTGEFLDNHAEIENGEDGRFAEAKVGCHECGAKGPLVDDLIHFAWEAADMERKAANLWNLRDQRHASMYEVQLCTYPRRNTQS